MKKKQLKQAVLRPVGPAAQQYCIPYISPSETSIGVQTDGGITLMVFWHAGGNHDDHCKKEGYPSDSM